MHKIESISDAYRVHVDAQLAASWSGPFVASRGVLHDTRTQPGFVAVDGGAVIGYVLYNLADGDCEITVLESIVKGRGAGSALIGEVMRTARESGSRRIWLITTNDNTQAIRFYQRFGFDLRAVHINSMEGARLLKPQIPVTGDDDIPIKHEFEFEILL